MRTLLCILFLVALITNCFSQSKDLIIEEDTLEDLEPKNGWEFEATDRPGIRYCDGKRCNGKIVDVYASGQTEHEAFYIDGRITGQVIEYYENGQIEEIGNLERGIKTGEWKYFYPTGSVESEIDFGYKRHEPIKRIEYYKGGQIKSYRKTDLATYTVTDYSFSAGGDTLSACYPINIEQGLYTYWTKFENGQIKVVGQKQFVLKKGWKDVGVWKWYNENGIEVKTVTY